MARSVGDGIGDGVGDGVADGNPMVAVSFEKDHPNHTNSYVKYRFFVVLSSMTMGSGGNVYRQLLDPRTLLRRWYYRLRR